MPFARTSTDDERRALPRGPRAPRARARPPPRPEGVLAPAPDHARVRRHVPPGRDLPSCRARAGLDARRAGRLEQRHSGLADEPHRAAPRGALRLAAGDDRGERPRGLRARPRAVQAARDDGRARLAAREVARRRGRRPTTRRSAPSSARCSSRRGASSSTASPASSRPSSSRSSGRRVRLRPPSSSSRATSATGARGDLRRRRRRVRREHRPPSMRFYQWRPG